MKKKEIINVLEENMVRSSNVWTFFCKNSKKLGLRDSDFKRVQKYMLEIENKRITDTIKLANKIMARELNVSAKQLLLMQKKANLIAQYFYTGHSMGSITRIRVKGHVLGVYDNTSEYPRGLKYKAIHGIVDINLTVSQLQKIKQIHHVWTIKGKNHKAMWLEDSGRKGSYSVSLIKGYLYGESHGRTLEEARDLFKQSYLAERAERIKEKEKAWYAKRKFVGLRDIKQTGACVPGIKGFASRHNLNVDYGYRLDYLLEMEPNNAFLQRLFPI